MNAKNNEYALRINKVLDYIENHYSEELSLEKIADIACFSKYHFHRIFYAAIGETLFDFIQRIRLEKSANKLIMSLDLPVSEIVYESGFSGHSAFARAFKEYFGMSATEWREAAKSGNSNLSTMKSNPSIRNSNFGKDIQFTTTYFRDVNNVSIIEWNCKMINKKDLKVEVKDFEEIDIAYIRHIGPYMGDDALFGRLIGQLCSWAGPRGLLYPGKSNVMSVYYDNPEITDHSKLRLDVCINIPKDTKIEGNTAIGKSNIPAGKYASAVFEISVEEYKDAWDFMYGEWLPQSGFQPEDKPCFEVYHNDPSTHPQQKHIVEIRIPVKPM